MLPGRPTLTPAAAYVCTLRTSHFGYSERGTTATLPTWTACWNVTSTPVTLHQQMNPKHGVSHETAEWGDPGAGTP